MGDAPTVTIADAGGRLGVLTPGMGAVSTTFIAGVLAARNGLAEPIGSLTQMGTVRLGKRTENRVPLIKDMVGLAGLDSLHFGGWDIFEDDAYKAASNAGVLEKELLGQLADELAAIKPMKAVFDKAYVKKLDGKHVKRGGSKWDLAQMLVEDIQRFQQDNELDRTVMIWCGSTEIFLKPGAVHESLEAFEAGLKKDDPGIAPSMIYAYAAAKLGVPYANGAPNLSVDFPALHELAKETRTPICGKDFKTGQTLLKTILAPGLKARMLGLSGWFSTNILGNRDGEVLDDPESFKTKEESKLGVLEHILQPDKYPQLYKDMYHKVRINYYPPHRHLRVARLPDADQDRLPVPRLDPRGADRPRPRPVPRPRQARRLLGHPGVAVVLLQEPDDQARPLPGARPVHPADEVEEHPPLHGRRGADHPPGRRLLRVLQVGRSWAATRCVGRRSGPRRWRAGPAGSWRQAPRLPATRRPRRRSAGRGR